MKVRIVVDEVELPGGVRLLRGAVVDSEDYPTLVAAGLSVADSSALSPVEAMKRK